MENSGELNYVSTLASVTLCSVCLYYYIYLCCCYCCAYCYVLAGWVLVGVLVLAGEWILASPVVYALVGMFVDPTLNPRLSLLYY